MGTGLVLATLACLPGTVAMAADEPGIEWNGYLNVVGGMLKEEPYDRVSGTGGPEPGRRGYSDEFSFDRDTSAGLQASRRIDDTTSITAQLYASGAQGQYATSMKWLYLTWDTSPQSRLKVGRIGRPVYYYSDFLDVGYAYHWVTPPEELYSLDVSMTGLHYTYSDTLGSGEWSAELMAGSEDQYLDDINADTQSRDIHGSVLTFTHGGWLTLRAALMRQKLSVQQELLDSPTLVDLAFADAVERGLIDQTTANALQPTFEPVMLPIIDEAVVIKDEPLEYRSLAVRIDRLDWFLMLESQQVVTDTYLYYEYGASYLTGGHRWGRWLVHATYAIFDWETCDLCKEDYRIAQTPIAQIPPAQLAEAFGRTVRSQLSVFQIVQEKTWTLGLNVDTSPNSVLKFELVRTDWSSPFPTATEEIGVNWLLRTALNVTF